MERFTLLTIILLDRSVRYIAEKQNMELVTKDQAKEKCNETGSQLLHYDEI